ncbi:hypothetical protein M3N64_04360 [Sporolactobacillus sp. CPB3-1]|uniref:Uncharacterized protein n=1 Tax=Sporolactobacillus mangiferae TaxID=2940498 RepID=A0ABT0MA12_9BACL|nr:hypothetical protein [Sporolactobacillus mangiferae]MCL1631180.1 hypothetical protein [Sporolactobacillus mangiferae]
MMYGQQNDFPMNECPDCTNSYRNAMNPYSNRNSNQNQNMNPAMSPFSHPNQNMNPGMSPYSNSNPSMGPVQKPAQKPDTQNLKNAVLSAIDPLVKYGLKEGKHTSFPHALRETAAIAYLMGTGYPLPMARQIVESWETDEMFYPAQPY